MDTQAQTGIPTVAQSVLLARSRMQTAQMRVHCVLRASIQQILRKWMKARVSYAPLGPTRELVERATSKLATATQDSLAKTGPPVNPASTAPTRHQMALVCVPAARPASTLPTLRKSLRALAEIVLAALAPLQWATTN